MTDKILYRVLCDEYEEVARIFFEIKETGEQIEGSHQIQKWINNVFNENEQLKKDCTVLIYHNQEYRKENEQLKKVFRELITSGYWDDDYLTEQDWNDLKRYIENVFEKVMMND